MDTALIHNTSKQCPRCGMWTQKNGGCNHMTCKNPECMKKEGGRSCDWCWVCGKDMNHAVTEHYSNGECHQFVDPPSPGLLSGCCFCCQSRYVSVPFRLLFVFCMAIFC